MVQRSLEQLEAGVIVLADGTFGMGMPGFVPVAQQDQQRIRTALEQGYQLARTFDSVNYPGESFEIWLPRDPALRPPPGRPFPLGNRPPGRR
jgi:hypothetical protein